MLRDIFGGIVLALVALHAFSVNHAHGAVVTEKGGTPSIPVLPDFQSYGLVSSDKGIGSGWWDLQQYGNNAEIHVGGHVIEKVIGVNSIITIDVGNPAWFNVSTSVRTFNGTTPTGNLNFSQTSSTDSMSSWFWVRDDEVQVWTGQFNDKDEPIYINEMWAKITFTLHAPALISHTSANFGSWKEEWHDDNDVVYFSRSGNEFSFYANGTFLGDNAQEIGKGMVAAGIASYGMIPEPAVIVTLFPAGIALFLHRRRNHK